MEVASLVIGIVPLVAAVQKSVRKIKDLNEAPTEFQCLSDEIDAFSAFLQDLETLATKGAGTSRLTNTTASFEISLLRGKESLNNIKDTLEKYQTEKNSKVRRLRWVRNRSSIQAYAQNIRDTRMEIVGALSIISQATISELGSLVSSLQHFSLIQKQLDQTTITASPDTSMTDHESTSQLQIFSQQNCQTVSETTAATAFGVESSLRIELNKSNYILIQESDRIGIQPQAGQFTMQTTVCSCVCHKVNRFTTPKFLLNYLGAVFVAHTGFTGATRECSDPYCRQPATPFGSIAFRLPPWICDMVATCVLTNTTAPELIIRVSRVVLAGGDIFQYVQHGDLIRLRELFSKKEASPFDITSTRGQSALHLAILLNKFEVSEFLLSENADRYLEDWDQKSVFDIAWDKILGNTVDEESRKRLRTQFPDTTYLEKRGFSNLHKSITGLSVLDLEKELSISSIATINKQDEDGKTPLAWAALRGDHSSVKLLLHYNSDITVSTHKGFTPLHLAAQSGDIISIQHLLRNGSDIDAKNDNQETPLHVATRYHDNPHLLKVLIDFKANQNCREQFRYTPLMCAVQEDHAQNVLFLLGSGAEIDAQDRRGFTALSFAIFGNQHKSMTYLLEYRADQTIISRRGRSLLHLVAMYADLDSVHILLKYPPTGLIDSQSKCDRGYTAIDMAKSRRSGVSEDWKSGFSHLLSRAGSNDEFI